MEKNFRYHYMQAHMCFRKGFDSGLVMTFYSYCTPIAVVWFDKYDARDIYKCGSCFVTLDTRKFSPTTTKQTRRFMREMFGNFYGEPICDNLYAYGARRFWEYIHLVASGIKGEKGFCPEQKLGHDYVSSFVAFPTENLMSLIKRYAENTKNQ